MNKPQKEFLTHLEFERKYSKKTVDSYSRDIDKFFRFLNSEGLLMDQVDLAVIRNFLTAELESGVSKRSCKRRLCALKHFYQFLVEKEYVKENYFEYVLPRRRRAFHRLARGYPAPASRILPKRFARTRRRQAAQPRKIRYSRINERLRQVLTCRKFF